MTADDVVRSACLALPEVTEKPSHGAPAFFVRKQFLMLWPNGHHDHHFPHLWFSAPPGVQADLVATEPDRFFRPPYVGGRGWVGVRLDEHQLAAICEDAYRAVDPPKLVALLDARRP